MLRIKNYKFEDDGSERDKYTIILTVNSAEAYVIHTLTTSQNRGILQAVHAGCQVYKHVPYYFFPAGHVVGDQGYFFDKDTYIFFTNNIRKEQLEKLQNAAQQSAFSLVPLGKLSSDELKRLLKCILKSSQLPQDVIAELESLKNNL